MPLAAGARLGAYEIVSLLGAGGMGEVYRARDLRLKREVAIKILPDAFANDPDRLARFQREAELLATLNHPNIAQIHGLETASGIQALVLELVEGPTLADRIAHGPIPLDEALPIAKQIVEALQAAHDRGVIHRDLKPANIKLTADGKVKVLDFGLAKALDPSDVGRNFSSAALSASPTITSPAMTMGGVILGTAAYMSPEQARGRPVDKRTDIWAFGCVLFEMVTGTRAFEGEDVTEILASIVKTDPDWRRLPHRAGPALRRLLRRCLVKERTLRLADIADTRLDLDDEMAPLPVELPPPANGSRRLTMALCTLSLVAGALLSTASLWFVWRPQPAARPLKQFLLNDHRAASPGFTFGSASSDPNLVISPDGQVVAYVAGNQTLHLRRLEQLEAVELSELGSVRSPFFSPDSQWVAFFVAGNNELRRVRVSGGPAVTIAATQGGARSGTWGADGTVVFVTNESGVWSVPSTGGNPTQFMRPDQNRLERFLTPHFLPGGREFLFTLVSGTGSSSAARVAVALRDLATGEQRTLIENGGHAQYASSGHLIFSREGTLFASRFDVATGRVIGEAVPILEGVQTGTAGMPYASVSSEGTLVYLPGTQREMGSRTLVWVDRSGLEEPLNLGARAYQTPRLAVDRTRLAVSLNDTTSPNIFTHDFRGNSWMRLTFSKTADLRPVWSADGRWIYFTGESSGLGIYRKASDGSGDVERVIPAVGDAAPSGTSPDSKILVFSTFDQTTASTGRDIWMLDLATRGPRPLVAESGGQGNAVVSPDGKWLAYSDEVQGYVFVRPFPDVSRGRWQVSPPNSKWPLWSRDGKELFFVSGAPRQLMHVAVDLTQSTPTWSDAQALFAAPYARFEGNTGPRNYDVSLDGRRFLVIKEAAASESQSPLVMENWFEEIKKRLPN